MSSELNTIKHFDWVIGQARNICIPISLYDNYNECDEYIEVIEKFLNTHYNSNGHEQYSNSGPINFHEFIMRGMFSKSFYIVFDLNNNSLNPNPHPNEKDMIFHDSFYIVINDDNIHFTRVGFTTVEYQIWEVICSYLNIYDCNQNFFNRLDVENPWFEENLQLFSEVIENSASDINPIIINNSERYRVFKINPNLLYSDYNLTLFKLKLINKLI